MDDQIIIDLIKKVSELTGKLDTYIEGHNKIHDENESKWKNQEFYNRRILIITGILASIGTISGVISMIVSISKVTA